MRKVRCSAGHYYDADKHASCPFCGLSNEAQPSMQTQPLNGGGSQTMGLDMQPAQGSMDSGSMGGGGGHTQPLDNVMSAASPSSGKTQALDSFASAQKQSGKTVAIGAIKSATGKTRMPVAGWLACISGPAKGKSYEVLTRGNKIGRNMQYNINVNEDLAISREVNAEIVYDKGHKKFFITPGTTNGLASLNDSIVLQPTELNEYDVITVGKSKFLFIALCGERFDWEGGDE